MQVNGKLRGTITLAVDADEATARAAALAEERVRAHVEGKTVKKFIYVKGKIVNFIVVMKARSRRCREAASPLALARGCASSVVARAGTTPVYGGRAAGQAAREGGAVARRRRGRGATRWRAGCARSWRGRGRSRRGRGIRGSRSRCCARTRRARASRRGRTAPVARGTDVGDRRARVGRAARRARRREARHGGHARRGDDRGRRGRGGAPDPRASAFPPRRRAARRGAAAGPQAGRDGSSGSRRRARTRSSPERSC